MGTGALARALSSPACSCSSLSTPQWCSPRVLEDCVQLLEHLAFFRVRAIQRPMRHLDREDVVTWIAARVASGSSGAVAIPTVPTSEPKTTPNHAGCGLRNVLDVVIADHPRQPHLPPGPALSITRGFAPVHCSVHRSGHGTVIYALPAGAGLVGRRCSCRLGRGSRRFSRQISLETGANRLDPHSVVSPRACRWQQPARPVLELDNYPDLEPV